MSTIDQLIQFDSLKTTNRFYKYSRFNYNAKFMLSVVHKFSRDKITMDGYFGYSTKKTQHYFRYELWAAQINLVEIEKWTRWLNVRYDKAVIETYETLQPMSMWRVDQAQKRLSWLMMVVVFVLCEIQISIGCQSVNMVKLIVCKFCEISPLQITIATFKFLNATNWENF